MEDVQNFVYQNLVIIIGAALIAGLLVAHNTRHLNWTSLRPRGYSRGKTMLRRQRRLFVDNLVTQEFVDSVEELVYNGAVTRSEASDIYRRMKQLFPIRNLFPSPEALKENIRHRIGKHVEANLPDKTKKVRPKNLFDPSPKRVTL